MILTRNCGFCGRPMDGEGISLRRKQLGIYCSKRCQSRASRGRIKVDLHEAPAKRTEKKMKYRDTLFFN